ncbi:LuxR C-terminal-related transcriptional regulator [Streptomyces sp. URMC 129]|uniref:LuxR C-terminal-related transcriptional regulator n=1 Tax=Streptomyces sp. URMC 129 TaxID=3423407 RepID=UPI003F1D1680
MPRLVGRDRELALLGALLGRHRLLTLTGPAGVGKSVLARAALAAAASPERDSVVLLDLADARDGGAAIARIRELLPPGILPFEQARTTRRSTAAAPARRLLVLLDNCDRVTASVADSVMTLLRARPCASVVCTSRVPLDVYAERIVPVGPMSTGERGDAVRLFTERVSPHYRHSVTGDEGRGLAARICEVVDGMPLAIELVAEAVGPLTPADLLKRLRHGEHDWDSRLRDLPERHSSVARVLGWGEAALSEEDTELLTRLTVFESVIDVPSARRLSGLAQDEITGALRTLVHKSVLMSYDNGRGGYEFKVPHMVRLHYRRVLARDPAAFAAAREQHARACLAFAQAVQRELRAAGHGAGDASRSHWVAAVHDRWPDIRAAVGYLRQIRRHTEALRLLLALEEPLSAAGTVAEFAAQLEESSRPDGRHDGKDGRALAAEASLIVARWAMRHGDLVRARAAMARAAAGYATEPGEREAPVLSREVAAGLTPRQRQIAHLVAEGLTNRQIATRLHISEWTVVNHLRQVMRKLECPSRIHVARVLRHRTG